MLIIMLYKSVYYHNTYALELKYACIHFHQILKISCDFFIIVSIPWYLESQESYFPKNAKFEKTSVANITTVFCMSHMQVDGQPSFWAEGY